MICSRQQPHLSNLVIAVWSNSIYLNGVVFSNLICLFVCFLSFCHSTTAGSSALSILGSMCASVPLRQAFPGEASLSTASYEDKPAFVRTAVITQNLHLLSVLLYDGNVACGWHWSNLDKLLRWQRTESLH